jgi:hypothetical protein
MELPRKVNTLVNTSNVLKPWNAKLHNDDPGDIFGTEFEQVTLECTAVKRSQMQ